MVIDRNSGLDEERKATYSPWTAQCRREGLGRDIATPQPRRTAPANRRHKAAGAVLREHRMVSDRIVNAHADEPAEQKVGLQPPQSKPLRAANSPANSRSSSKAPRSPLSGSPAADDPAHPRFQINALKQLGSSNSPAISELPPEQGNHRLQVYGDACFTTLLEVE
jgi:hypothetical protein